MAYALAMMELAARPTRRRRSPWRSRTWSARPSPASAPRSSGAATCRGSRPASTSPARSASPSRRPAATPAAMRTRAVRRGDRWVLDGEKQWITSGDVAGVMVVWARTDPGAGRARASPLPRARAARPASPSGGTRRRWASARLDTVSLAFDGCEIPDDGACSGRSATGSGSRWRRSTAGASASPPRRPARSAPRSTRAAATRRSARPSAGPSPSTRRSRSCSPTWRTEHDAARLMALRAAALKEAGAPFTREAAMAKLFASEAAQRAVSTRRADPRRLRLHRGVPGRAALPRRARADDLRGDERDPAARHRPAPALGGLTLQRPG